jgi:hypothetical protein
MEGTNRVAATIDGRRSTNSLVPKTCVTRRTIKKYTGGVPIGPDAPQEFARGRLSRPVGAGLIKPERTLTLREYVEERGEKCQPRHDPEHDRWAVGASGYLVDIATAMVAGQSRS